MREQRRPVKSLAEPASRQHYCRAACAAVSKLLSPIWSTGRMLEMQIAQELLRAAIWMDAALFTVVHILLYR